MQLDKIEFDLEQFKLHSGLFYEIGIQRLEELIDTVTSNFQTMVYFGFECEELMEFCANSDLRGIDRIVPIGKSLDFSLNWDGYDLIGAMSRNVVIID